MPQPMLPGAGASVLDGPPPSPTPAAPEGQFQVRGLVPGGSAVVPTGAIPPEILTGITSAATKIAEMLDAFAQATPDKAAQLALIKDLLQRYLADLMVGGAGAVSPTASGPAPPMGGIDRGIAGAGTV